MAPGIVRERESAMAATRNGTDPKSGIPRGNRVKDPEAWTTGEEPMTEAQKSYLRTLAEETGETIRDEMTKAEASEKIDELRTKSVRVEADDPN